MVDQPGTDLYARALGIVELSVVFLPLYAFSSHWVCLLFVIHVFFLIDSVACPARCRWFLRRTKGWKHLQPPLMLTSFPNGTKQNTFT